MRKMVKYSQLFLGFWIQLWLFATLIPAAMGGDWSATLFICGQLAYFTISGIYCYMFLSLKLSELWQQRLELLMTGIGMLLAIIYSGIILTDPWLWQSEKFIGFDFIGLMIWIGILLVTSAVSFFYCTRDDYRLNIQKSKLWNTYKTADLWWLSVIIISGLVLTIMNTKLVYGVTREYWQNLRTVGTCFIIFITWYYSRYFRAQRYFFIAMIGGYFGFVLIETLQFLLIEAPLTKQTLISFGQKTTGVDYAIYTSLVHLTITMAWTLFLNYREKKSN
ncbi:MAG: hypothetical protein ACRC6X_05330 [Culicoidibacterales bacterium]